MRSLTLLGLLLAACNDSKFNSGRVDGGLGDLPFHFDGSQGGDMAQAAALPCNTGGSEITTIPNCSAPLGKIVNVPRGCTPSVDGTLHAAEWSDGACFLVGDGDMTVTIKYSNDAVYMATSGQPTCGCGMPFTFDPDGSGSANGNEFLWSVVDDPFNTDGDHAEMVLSDGTWVTGQAPTGIVELCPGNQPSPVRFEWKIPFSAVGIAAGQSHTFRMAISHSGQVWPSGLSTAGFSTDPTTWGQLSSAANWK